MDPYRILGIEKSATPDEVRRAYKEKAKKHHPDSGGDDWAFRQVTEAFEQIQNERSDWDDTSVGQGRPEHVDVVKEPGPSAPTSADWLPPWVIVVGIIAAVGLFVMWSVTPGLRLGPIIRDDLWRFSPSRRWIAFAVVLASSIAFAISAIGSKTHEWRVSKFLVALLFAELSISGVAFDGVESCAVFAKTITAWSASLVCVGFSVRFAMRHRRNGGRLALRLRRSNIAVADGDDGVFAI